MNEIDWTTHKLYVYTDRTGIIETGKDNLDYTLTFEWFIDSFISDLFNISIDFDTITVYDKNTGDHIEIPSDPYQEYIRELVENEINNDPESLGLDSYMEDRYLDFD
jgi:hypothetical protein